MANEEVDYYYSPSKFSIRDSATTVDTHIEILNKATLDARQILKCDIGMQYLPSGHLIDLYYPSLGVNDDTVIFLYIHGGYWQALSLDESGYLSVPLANNNILLGVVGYDLAPKVTMGTIVEQCREACVFLYKRFPKNKLYVGGHSAGGHLSALMLTSEWSKYDIVDFPFNGAVLLSGVYDLKPIQMSYINDPLQLTDLEVTNFSPLLCDLSHLPANFPCLIGEGEMDSPEFKKQRIRYCECLESAGVDITLKIMEGDDHFTLIEKLISEENPLTKILIDFLLQKT